MQVDSIRTSVKYIWDFTLSDEDMGAISALDLGHSEIIDHGSAETAKLSPGSVTFTSIMLEWYLARLGTASRSLRCI